MPYLSQGEQGGAGVGKGEGEWEGEMWRVTVPPLRWYRGGQEHAWCRARRQRQTWQKHSNARSSNTDSPPPTRRLTS